jgi:dihydroorotate dehydrogenase electron transfer subunit
MVLGGADDAHVLEPLAARRSVGHVDVVVGDMAPAILRVLGDTQVVYAAGTTATLRLVAAAAAEGGLSCQVALERPMTCATGLCHGCPVAVLDDAGDPHLVRACVEGPVFRAERLDWEALRDAEGVG